MDGREGGVLQAIKVEPEEGLVIDFRIEKGRSEGKARLEALAATGAGELTGGVAAKEEEGRGELLSRLESHPRLDRRGRATRAGFGTAQHSIRQVHIGRLRQVTARKDEAGAIGGESGTRATDDGGTPAGRIPEGGAIGGDGIGHAIETEAVDRRGGKGGGAEAGASGNRTTDVQCHPRCTQGSDVRGERIEPMGRNRPLQQAVRVPDTNTHEVSSGAFHPAGLEIDLLSGGEANSQRLLSRSAGPGALLRRAGDRRDHPGA